MQTPTVTPSQKHLALGFSWLLVLAGIALLVFGINFVRTANASRGWPTVTGTVQNVSVKWDISGNTDASTKDREYYYVVTYAYKVDGQPFSGRRYSLGSGSTASKRYNAESQARATAQANYPPGSSVTVYYDPSDPAEAVLKPGASWDTYVPILLGVIFIPSGAVLIRSISKQKQSQLDAAKG